VATTVNGTDAFAVAVPAVPEMGTVKLPGAIVAEVVNTMVAAPEGTLIGNVDVVVSPAGSVPKVMVGVAVVPNSLAVTVTEKETLGDTLTVAGVALRERVGAGVGAGEEPLPVLPPHPTKVVPVKRPRQIAADRAEVRAYMNISDKSADRPRAYQRLFQPSYSFL
jgi:hypothetical protein